MKPLVSVIIPSYNRADTLERSVRSVLNQSHRNLECIVVDDASTDHSASVVAALASTDQRLKLIQLTENGGPALARNIGANAATGEWLAFQDSDDEWLPEKITLQLAAAQQDQNCGMVFCRMRRIKQNGYTEMAPTSLSSGKVNVDKLLANSIAWTITLMVKRTVFEAVNGFDTQLKRLEDWDLSIKVANKTTAIYHDDILSIAYESAGSLLSNHADYAKYFALLLENHSQLFQQYPSIQRQHQTTIAFHRLYWHASKPSWAELGSMGWRHSKTWLLFALSLLPLSVRTRIIRKKTGWQEAKNV